MTDRIRPITPSLSWRDKDNPWDDDPHLAPLPLATKTVRLTGLKQLGGHLHTLSKQQHVRLTLIRARQLARLEPIFQACLSPDMQRHIQLASIGQKFWLVTAESSVWANRARYQLPTLRVALKGYLQREVPVLKIKVQPRRFQPKDKPKPIARSLPASAIESLSAAAAQITHPALAQYLKQMVARHSTTL